MLRTEAQKKEADERLKSARKIQEQIGHEALLMLGAYNLTAEEDGFSCRFRGCFRGCQKLNWLKVRETPYENYTLEFCHVGDGPDFEITGNIWITALQPEQFCEIIERETGLLTSLVLL